MEYTLDNYAFETVQLHAGQEEADPASDSRAVPIYQTTSYVFRNCDHAADRFGLRDAGNIYSRLTNSTTDIFEKRINALEGGAGAVATASGAAALFYTFLNLAKAGDNIVVSKNIYGGTYNLLAHTLPEYGITAKFVDPRNLNEWETAIDENTKALFTETIGNPNADVSDLDAISKIAHSRKIPLATDATFSTPYLYRPKEHGADIIVHSATKFIGGHGTAVGGVVIDSGTFDWKDSGKFPHLVEPNPSYHGVSFYDAAGPAAFTTAIRAILLRDTGATQAPLHSFLFLQGLETLSLRIDRHIENTKKVLDYLVKSPYVKKVNHPSLPSHPDYELFKRDYPNGGASIFTFEIDGDEKQTRDFIDALEIFSLLANVADVKSLVIHPASTTHAQLNEKELLYAGITPSTVRVSIGTEHYEDLIHDLDQAFHKVFD